MTERKHHVAAWKSLENPADVQLIFNESLLMIQVLADHIEDESVENLDHLCDLCAIGRLDDIRALRTAKFSFQELFQMCARVGLTPRVVFNGYPGP